MDILTATSAAFLAGIVEGASVLKHHCENNKESGDEQSLIIPSLVYGSMSLPLAVIGSSPSVGLVSRYSHVHIQEHVTAPDEPVIGESSKDSSSQSNQSEPSIRRMKLGLAGNAESDSQNEDKLTNPNGGRNVLRMREENRRVVAAMYEKKLVEKEMDASNTVSQVQGRHNDYHGQLKGRSRGAISILGKALPTTLAENMRKVRILLLGYSIVSATVLYQKFQLDRNENHAQRNCSQKEKQLIAIQNYMQCKECKAGVAMRVMIEHQDINELKRVQQSPRSQLMGIPCSFPITSSTQEYESESEGSIPVWSLGGHASDWFDIPLNKRMLFGSGSGQFVILESITSTSLLEGVLSQQRGYLKQTNEHQSILQTEISSRLIQNALKAKYADSVGIAHIMIGTTMKHASERGSFDILATDRIRLNSMDVVASRIIQSVHLALSRETEKSSQDAAKEIKKTDFHNHISQSIIAAKGGIEENRASSNILLRAIDTVGMQIRNGCRKVVEVATNTVVGAVDTVGRQVRTASQTVLDAADNVGNLLIKTIKRSPDYKGIIHVFSDDLELVFWAKSIMTPRDFHVIWHDIRRDDYKVSLTKQVFDEKSKEIFLVLTKNDISTIHTTTTLASIFPEKQMKKIISIVEKGSSCETLVSLLRPDNGLIIEPICVASIHEELIAHAKRILVSERLEANQVQDIMLSRLKQKEI